MLKALLAILNGLSNGMIVQPKNDKDDQQLIRHQRILELARDMLKELDGKAGRLMIAFTILPAIIGFFVKDMEKWSFSVGMFFLLASLILLGFVFVARTKGLNIQNLLPDSVEAINDELKRITKIHEQKLRFLNWSYSCFGLALISLIVSIILPRFILSGRGGEKTIPGTQKSSGDVSVYIIYKPKELA